MRSNGGPLVFAMMCFVTVAVTSVLLGAVGAAAAAVLCGDLDRSALSIWGGAVFLFGGGSELIGAPAGCTVASGWVRAAQLVLLLLIVTVAIVAAIKWKQYTLTDQYFRRQLRSRDGFAGTGELTKWLSRKALMKRAPVLRPTLPSPKPTDVGWRVGRSKGIDVYVSIEDSVLLEGAPRSGKGFRIIIGAILDWAGPLVTTSTRNDNLAATMQARQARGNVTVFDPQGLSGVRSALRISPITGCENPLIAAQRAEAIVAGTALGSSNSNQEWAEKSATVLRCLLHAAAVTGQETETLRDWGSDPRLAEEAIKLLTDHGSPGWDHSLAGILRGDEKMRDSSWFGVAAALAPLAIPSILEAMSPRPEEEFDADSFLSGENTLYLIGTGAGAGAVGGFLGAIVDDIVETARRKALASVGSRLDPPLGLVLDEIANMFYWRGLPRAMADGGGIGISTMTVLQTLSQAVTAWSQAEADTIWSAATAKLILGGASNVPHLQELETLLGTRKSTTRSRNYSDSGTSTNVQAERLSVATVDELKRLPEGMGVLSYRNRRGVLLDIAGWITRSDANDVRAGKNITEAEQLRVFAEQYQVARAARVHAQSRREPANAESA